MKPKLPSPGKGAIILFPLPTRLEGPLLTEREIDTHRRPHCVRYNACLDRSVREGWGGFSCARCPLRDAAPPGLSSERFAHHRPVSNLE